MARQRDLDKLLSDLRSFLLILDRENLSAAAQAKKKSVADLLRRLQSPPAEDAEYMIMRCLAPSSGTGSLQSRASSGPRPGSGTPDALGGRACECPPASAPSSPGRSKAPGVLPSLQSSPADDSYEEAEPVSPGGRVGSGGADSDSSHYESYGEDEECVKDRAHYLRWPPAAGPDADPLARPEAQLCGFLWRKRWLGQWAKQLFIVREHVLLCFKCAKDLQPLLELDLRGCRVAYKAKPGKKMQHELKVTGTAGEALVIGFQSRQQAEDWRKVWRCRSLAELCMGRGGQGEAGAQPSRVLPQGPRAAAGAASVAGCLPVRAVLGAPLRPGERAPAAATLPLPRQVIEEVSSDSPSGLAAHSAPVSPASPLGRAANPRLSADSDSDRSPRSPARSPPRRDAAHGGRDGEPGGFLAVRLSGRWQRLWCAVRQGALRMFAEPGGAQRPVCAVPLRGCEVTPGDADADAAGTPQRLRIHIAQRGEELAVLETRSDEEREAWLKTLRARGGAEPACERTHAGSPSPGDASGCPAAGGLLLRRFPTPNAYMDDPFGQLPPAASPDPVYSNAERLQQLQQSLDRAAHRQHRRPLSAVPTGAYSNAPGRAVPSQAACAAPRLGKAASQQRVEVSPELKNRDFFRSQRTLTLPERKGARDGLDFLIGKRAFPKLEEKVGQLERACRVKSRLKAGSEMNLLAIGKSLKGHIAATTSSAGSEGSFFTPLLKRTASAKSALKRAPSVVIIEKGKVLQKRKEWEMKSAM